MSFRVKMEQVAKNKKSNVVLALDFPFEQPQNRGKLFSKAEHVLEAVHPYICAAKFNHHLILPLGVFDGVQKLVKKTHDLGLQAIMDCKANDIGSTNQVIAEYYFDAGFDALTANPFVGWEEGLKPVFEVSKKLENGVILLVYMSHKAAAESYGQTIFNNETGSKQHQYVDFAKKALDYGASGTVVGATYPEKIKEIYDILHEKVPIYSPGIGAQGGSIRPALEAGSRYIIVGREIAQAADPTSAAKRVRELSKSVR